MDDVKDNNLIEDANVEVKSSTQETMQDIITSTVLVPDKNKTYVPFGQFEDIMSVVKSRMFYTVYVTGLSGNGKTLMVEQACARAKRELLRLNITAETDEDDLLGGFRLKNDNGVTKTVFQPGPVPIAMQRGAVLLLDEIDCATPKLMALQPILEGKPVYLKKINKVVHPAPGFNILATANTKGRGDIDGKFVGTNIMNEALLERFTITIEQPYPPLETERKILKNVMALGGPIVPADEAFIENLVKWSETIRALYMDGGCSDVMSTRRLCGLVTTYCIFNRNRMKAIELATNRFDEDTKRAWLDLYSKIDAEVNRPKAPKHPSSGSQTVPF